MPDTPFAAPVERLIEYFQRLPGIGRKSAQRLAFHIMSMDEKAAQGFADAILDVKHTIFQCKICQNLTDRETCAVCSNPARDQSTVCVVESPTDVAAIERNG